jgi:sialic acid synthase SpsE
MSKTLMIRDIPLASRRIGRHHPPFIIAELSGNHNPWLERALAMVEAAEAFMLGRNIVR